MIFCKIKDSSVLFDLEQLIYVYTGTRKENDTIKQCIFLQFKDAKDALVVYCRDKLALDEAYKDLLKKINIQE